MRAKRFEMKGDTHIFDSQTSEEYYAPSEYELVDLLNEQQEEIDYLKDLISAMKSDIKNAMRMVSRWNDE